MQLDRPKIWRAGRGKVESIPRDDRAKKAPLEEVSGLLRAWSSGNRDALERLTPIVYDELHRLARSYMRRERPGHSLQATALVNEAYMRLVDYKGMQWQNRAHFFAVSAQLMRRILVDHARSHNAAKRGGLQIKLQLDDAIPCSDVKREEMIALDDALNRLASWDPRQSRIVELRFFGGLTEKEVGEVLGVSERTVKREWQVARAWLHGQLSGIKPK